MNPNISSCSFSKLQKEALLAIDKHINLDKLYEELQEENDSAPIDGNEICVKTRLTNLTLQDYTALYAQLTGIDLVQSYINIFINQLHNLTTDRHHIKTNESKLKYIWILIDDAYEYSALTKKVSECAAQFEHCLPIDILFRINEKSILTLDIFLKENINRNWILKEFVHGLQQCSLDEEENTRQSAAGLICHVINYGYCEDDSHSKPIQKLSQHILHFVFKYLLFKLSASNAKFHSIQSGERHNVFHIIWSNGVCEVKTLTNCFTLQLLMWISYNPTFKVSDAITQQDQWRASTTSYALVEVYKEMLVYIGLEATLSIIHKAFCKKQVNWESLLTFVSTILITFPEAATAFDVMIVEEIKKGMEEMNTDNLVIGTLLARQCTSEGNHVFMSYTNWFQKHFGSGSHCLVNSPRNFRFLVKFWTSLVPCEPVQYIKVHICHAPRLPNPALKDLWQDYASLVRTRLDDLKYIFPSNSESDDVVNLEVNSTIKLYEKKGKVPTSLIEMSIFQRSYYLGKFLPVLLQARPQLPAVEDGKMKLISALLKLEKIPKLMYEKYKTECSSKLNQVNKGATVIGKSSDTAGLLDDFKANVSAFLQQDFSTTTQIANNDHSLKITRCLQQLASLINASGDKCTPTTSVDLRIRRDFPDVLLKMTDVLTEVLSKVAANANHLQLRYLMRILSNDRLLKEAVCEKVWSTCINEMILISSAAQRGFVLLLCGSDTEEWSVIYSPRLSPQQNKPLEQGTNHVMHKISSLLHAVIESLPYCDNFNQFMRCAQFQTALAKQYSLLENSQCNDEKSTPAILLTNLQFQRARIMSYMEFYQADFMEAKRQKMDDTALSMQQDMEELTHSVNEVCRLIQEMEFSMEDKFSVVGFIEREIWMSTDSDLLSSAGRRYLYNNMFFQQTILPSDLENVVNIFLNNWKTINNQEVVDYFASNLTLLLSASECDVSAGEWLLRIIGKRWNELPCSAKGDIAVDASKRAEVYSMYHFLLRLPSNFMFNTNVLSSSFYNNAWSQSMNPIENICQPVKEVVNNYLRNHGNVLIYNGNLGDLYSHLLRGYFQSTPADDPIVLAYLIENIPIFFIFLLTSWNKISDVRWTFKLSHTAMHETVMWAYQLITEPTLSAIEVGECLEKMTVTSSHYLTSLCVSLIHSNFGRDSNNMSTILAKLAKHSRNIWHTFFSCLTAYCGYLLELDPSFDVRYSNGILKSLSTNLDPSSLFQSLFEPDEIIQLIVPDSTVHLFFFQAAKRLFTLIPFASKFFSDDKVLPGLLELQLKSSRDTAGDVPEFQFLLVKSARQTATEVLKNALTNPDLDDGTRSALTTELHRRYYS